MISVVLPVYNVEGYIEECLNSIVQQTYKDLEIICVDDCTLDNSTTMIKQYAKKDKRIKIIVHKENRGLGGARNTGIAHATGEYICFIDSDDYIEPTMLQEMHDAIEKHDVDAVVCGIRRFSGGSTLTIETGFHYLKNCRNGIYDVQSNKANLIHMWPSVCNKLYKTNIIKKNQLHFPERLLYEDHFFYYNYFFHIKNFYYINKPFYNYRAAREGSITTNVTGREKEVYTVLRSLKKVFWSNLPEATAKQCYARVAFRLIWERQMLFWNDTPSWMKFCEEAEVFLSKEFPKDFLQLHVDTLVDHMDPFYRFLFTQGLKRKLFIIKLKVKNYPFVIWAKNLRDRIKSHKSRKKIMREIWWLSWNNREKLQELSWPTWNTHDRLEKIECFVSNSHDKMAVISDEAEQSELIGEKEMMDEKNIAV